MELDWKIRMDKAFSEGMQAKSCFDNPYWKSYPRGSTVEDESMARHWVDGYVSKLKGSDENA